jgi:hypothetical protein
MRYRHFPLGLVLVPLTVASAASAVSSAELYQNQTYTYGRFEARIQFAAGDGVISSFFLWKPGSEMAGTFWNELDFEKLGADCRLQTNPLYGLPVARGVRWRHVAERMGARQLARPRTSRLARDLVQSRRELGGALEPSRLARPRRPCPGGVAPTLLARNGTHEIQFALSR